MSRWDLLVRVATLPEISRARYGFTANRRGGCQLDNPSGDAWPRSRYINCCTWAAQSLGLAQHLLGLGGRLSIGNWLTAMCVNVGDPGAPQMAVDMGLADELLDTVPDDLAEGSWAVCQGWKGSGGHSFLVRGVPAGDGEAELGFLMLEAVGRPRGGAWRGLDGVGSRTVPSRPNARDWAGGCFPEDTAPISRAAMLDLYPTFFSARLI